MPRHGTGEAAHRRPGFCDAPVGPISGGRCPLSVSTGDSPRSRRQSRRGMSSTCRILPWLRTDRIDPAEPKLRMEPAEPIDKMLPADPTESMEPADPNDMIEPTENTDWIEPVEQNARMDLVENRD